MSAGCGHTCCEYLPAFHVSSQICGDFRTKASRKPRLFVQAEKAEKQSRSLGYWALTGRGQAPRLVAVEAHRPCSGIRSVQFGMIRRISIHKELSLFYFSDVELLGECLLWKQSIRHFLKIMYKRLDFIEIIVMERNESQT